MDIDKYLRNNLCDADYAEASAQLEADWQAAYQAGRRAGASAMRERAANEAHARSQRPYDSADSASEAIRALPLDEGGK